MPRPLPKLENKIFGRLKVISHNEKTRLWNCECSCGNLTQVQSNGEAKTASEWCELLKIDRYAIYRKIKEGELTAHNLIFGS